MNISERIGFKRNLTAFLGSTRLARTATAGRTSGAAKSLSSDPVDPIDAVFTTVSDEYTSGDQPTGFESVTRQILASDVLDTLLQMQSEMSLFGDFAPNDMEGMEQHATAAYRKAQQDFPLSLSR